MSLYIPVVRLNKDLPLPHYATKGDAGMDLYASEGIVLPAGGTAVVPTGIAVAIPSGRVGLVHPRSGLAAKHGITVLNAPGTIDSGFRGEVGVILHNASASSYTIKVGDRIAQLVIQEYVTAELFEVEELSSSERGTGAFGSTGFGLTAAH